MVLYPFHTLLIMDCAISGKESTSYPRLYTFNDMVLDAPYCTRSYCCSHLALSLCAVVHDSACNVHIKALHLHIVLTVI